MGISVDDLDDSRDLVKKLDLGFALLSDPDLRAIHAYGVADESNSIAWPSEFIVERGGRIRWRATAQAVGKRPSADDVLHAFDASAEAAPSASSPVHQAR